MSTKYPLKSVKLKFSDTSLVDALPDFFSEVAEDLVDEIDLATLPPSTTVASLLALRQGLEKELAEMATLVLNHTLRDLSGENVAEGEPLTAQHEGPNAESVLQAKGRFDLEDVEAFKAFWEGWLQHKKSKTCRACDGKRHIN